MNVTKQEFVDQVANEAGLGKGEATKAVDAFLEVVTSTPEQLREIETLYHRWQTAKANAARKHARA